MCRLSEPEGSDPGSMRRTHFGGSRSANEQARLIVREKNISDDQVDWEVFKTTQLMNGVYTSAKTKQIAERVHTIADEIRAQQDPNNPQEVEYNPIYIQVAKEFSKKGRMIGIGDRASMYTGCGSQSSTGSVFSSGVDSETMTQQLSSLQNELHTEHEERRQLEERLAQHASESAAMKEHLDRQLAQAAQQTAESAAIKKQLDMILQQLSGRPPPSSPPS